MDYASSVKVMKAALEQGANFWNGVSTDSPRGTRRQKTQTTSSAVPLIQRQRLTDHCSQGMIYGTPEANSLHLAKYYFTQYPEDADRVVLSIKGAYDAATHTPQGQPAQIRAAVDECLRVLDGTKKLDVFEMARVDPTVPIEESVAALAALVDEGKIGGVGLSEVSGPTIRRAAAVTRIAAVEIELGLLTPDPLTNGVAAACRERMSLCFFSSFLFSFVFPFFLLRRRRRRELTRIHAVQIPMIAYSPAGRGMLTSQVRSLDDLAPDDYRRRFPRFQAEAFAQNVKLADAVRAMAARKGASPTALAISWVVRQGAVALPGTASADRVVENCTDVKLDEDDLAEIQGLLDTLPVVGERYGGKFEKLLNQ